MCSKATLPKGSTLFIKNFKSVDIEATFYQIKDHAFRHWLENMAFDFLLVFKRQRLSIVQYSP